MRAMVWQCKHGVAEGGACWPCLGTSITPPAWMYAYMPIFSKLTLRDVAHALNVHETTVLRWVRAGVIKGARPKSGYRKGGWRIKRSALRKAILTQPRLARFASIVRDSD